MTPRYRLLAALAVLPFLWACRGSWAQPTDVTLAPVPPSHVSALAEVGLAVMCTSRCTPTGGSTISVSSSGTVATHSYELILADGSCSRPNVTGTSLDHRGGAGFAQLGSTHVAIPLHELVKHGYILVLRDRTARRPVACGAIHSDAIW